MVHYVTLTFGKQDNIILGQETHDDAYADTQKKHVCNSAS